MPADPTSTPTLRPLAVCIDDLGLHAGVNAAAFELAGAGRVSSWSCLVDGPAIAEVAQWLAREPHDNLEVGLHLNFTEALGEAGLVRPLQTLIMDSYRGALDAAAVARELGRQFDRFAATFGRAPDFIDGHQHVHQLPVIREALLAELARRFTSVARRPWLRRCARPAAGAALPLPERFKPVVIQALGCGALQEGAQAAGWPQNRRLLGVRRFLDDDAGFQALLAAWLDRAGQADLLMVHPAKALPGVDDALLAARETEYRVLRSDAFAQLLVAAQLRVQPLARSLAAA